MSKARPGTAGIIMWPKRPRTFLAEPMRPRSDKENFWWRVPSRLWSHLRPFLVELMKPNIQTKTDSFPTAQMLFPGSSEYLSRRLPEGVGVGGEGARALGCTLVTRVPGKLSGGPGQFTWSDLPDCVRFLPSFCQSRLLRFNKGNQADGGDPALPSQTTPAHPTQRTRARAGVTCTGGLRTSGGTEGDTQSGTPAARGVWASVPNRSQRTGCPGEEGLAVRRPIPCPGGPTIWDVSGIFFPRRPWAPPGVAARCGWWLAQDRRAHGPLG